MLRNCAHPLLCSIRERRGGEGDAEVTVYGTVSGKASIIGHDNNCKINVEVKIRTKSYLDISTIPLNL